MSGPDDHSAALRNGISNAMARIMREFYGKGPARTRTYVFDNLVFSILDDVLTTVERTLQEAGRGDLVRRTRLTFEDIMTRAFTGEVEKLTGARVIAYHSLIGLEPDMAVEIFVLDRPAHALAPERRGPDVESAELAPPGAVGDADELPEREGERPVLAGRGSARGGDGQVRAAIANAMVRLVHEHWGKGPTRAKTFIRDEFVFSVLEDPLTTVERTLVEGGEQQLVRELRLEFLELKNAEFARQVETLTDRKVQAAHSQVVFDPDILFIVFALDGYEKPRTASTASSGT